MCGIAGYFVKRPVSSAAGLRAMLAAIRQRGPDDEGVFLASRGDGPGAHYRADRSAPAIAARLPHYDDASVRIPHDMALLHARYAIVDLAARAHQPFVSADGAVTAIFHGEIYNYRELRAELVAAGSTFRTTSDTEVLVEGYRAWRDALWPRLNGFWAVALFDSADASVVLCRDRLGVAPLYYRETAAGLSFASTIAALHAVAARPADIDSARVADFIATGLKDIDDRTCYTDIRSLPAATAVHFPPGVFTVAAAHHARFWRPPSRRLTESELPFIDAVEQYRATFMSAVDLRLQADVPVACELSGGLDSASIVAAAATLGRRDITTYTISVPESNELPYALAMRERYPLDFHVLPGAGERFADDARDFARIIEEPYHSPNIYTHYLMRRRMKADGVSVVLSGSGGDEVLAGYESEFWSQAAVDLRANGRRWQALVHDVVARAATSRRRRETVRGLAHRVLRNMAPSRVNGAAAGLPVSSALQIRERHDGASLAQRYPTLSFHDQMLYHLQVANLPYYLRSNDHFTMAIPVEHRFPFLDFRMVELGLRVTTSYLFRNGWTKFILRKAMEPFLPARVTWRREKMGFPFPLRPFLGAHGARFAPLLDSVAAAGLTTDGKYEAMMRDEPLRLWRACATGLWLEAHGHRVGARD